MTCARAIIVLIAGLSLLFANTSWRWQLFAMAGFVLASFLIHIQIQKLALIRGMRLYPDGTVTLLTGEGDGTHAFLRREAWVSRWLIVICVQRLDRGSARRLIIACSNNDPDNYRRLARLLRLGVSADVSDNMIKQP